VHYIEFNRTNAAGWFMVDFVLLDRCLHDGVVSLRRFDERDRDILIAGRDADSKRFLGDEPLESNPVACVCVVTLVVGWIDYDQDRSWLLDGEANVGYNVFPPFRGHGYGTQALVLCQDFLEGLEPPLCATLLIDPQNAASLSLAARAGFREVAQLNGEVLLKHDVDSMDHL
jgi:RimJ/RimL family protein N-acetyltransferase